MEPAAGEARHFRRAFSDVTGRPATSGKSSGGKRQILVFALDDLRYGLPLSAVERAIRAVEITPLPKAPEIIQGIINCSGLIVAAVDLRRRFRIPARRLRLSDQLILARTFRRTVGLSVDRVEGLAECAESEIVAAESVLRGMEYVQGVAKLESGIVLIHDLDTFLSLDEEANLGTALAETGT